MYPENTDSNKKNLGEASEGAPTEATPNDVVENVKLFAGNLQEALREQREKNRLSKESQAIAQATGDDYLAMYILLNLQTSIKGLNTLSAAEKDQLVKKFTLPKEEALYNVMLNSRGYVAEDLEMLLSAIIAPDSELSNTFSNLLQKCLTVQQDKITVADIKKWATKARKKSIESSGPALKVIATTNLVSSAETAWQCFLPSSQSVGHSWNTNQEKWGKLCFSALQQSLEKTKKGEFNHSAFALYEWLCEARAQIAVELGHSRENHFFGKLRNATFASLLHDFGTPITTHPGSAFKDQYKECDTLMQQLENAKTNRHITQIKAKHENKAIDVYIIKDPNTGVFLSKFYRSTTEGHEVIKICHTRAIHTATIFAKNIQPLYEEILSTPNQETEKLYYLIGKIAYYLAHLAPCEAGSASISDMFVRQLMAEKSLPLLPYKPGLQWDIAAIFNPDLEAWANNYATLFEQPKQNLTLAKSG